MAARDSKRDSRPGRHRDVADDDFNHAGWDEPRLMDFARKLVRGGVEIVGSTQDAIRVRAGDMRAKEIPKEVVESVAHLTVRTKDELISLMAREFKNYLEKLDLAGELRSIFEQYTLDVNMSIRLRPNDPLDDDPALDDDDDDPSDALAPDEDESPGEDDEPDEDEG